MRHEVTIPQLGILQRFIFCARKVVIEIALTTINDPDRIDVNKVSVHLSRILQCFYFCAKKRSNWDNTDENQQLTTCWCKWGYCSRVSNPAKLCPLCHKSSGWDNPNDNQWPITYRSKRGYCSSIRNPVVQKTSDRNSTRRKCSTYFM